jgi:hypothetical protein
LGVTSSAINKNRSEIFRVSTGSKPIAKTNVKKTQKAVKPKRSG